MNNTLTKKQLDLLKYLQNGGKADVIYMPMVYAGDMLIPYGAYLKLLQEGLVEANDRGDGVEKITLTEDGCRLVTLRRVSEKVVNELKTYSQLELV